MMERVGFGYHHVPAALSRKTERVPSLLRRATAEEVSSPTGDATLPKRFAFRYFPVTRENSGRCPSSSLSKSSTGGVTGIKACLSLRSSPVRT
jgi:hypothetical protein